MGETLSSLVALAVRLDERVRGMTERMSGLGDRLNTLDPDLASLVDRVGLLEARREPVEAVEVARRELEDHVRRLCELEGSVDRSAGRWRNVGDVVLHILGVVVAAYLLAKLGLKP